MLLEYSKDTVI